MTASAALYRYWAAASPSLYVYDDASPQTRLYWYGHEARHPEGELLNGLLSIPFCIGSEPEAC